MPQYLVTWTQDQEADTPEQAARQAWESMRRENSDANCFKVQTKRGGRITEIDLQQVFDEEAAAQQIIRGIPPGDS